MVDARREAHAGRAEGVVAGKGDAALEDATLVGRPLGALDDGLPGEKVVLCDGACRDALWAIEGQLCGALGVLGVLGLLDVLGALGASSASVAVAHSVQDGRSEGAG